MKWWNTLWYREHPIVVPQNLPLAALLYTMWSMSKYVEHVTFRYVHSKAELLTWKKLKHTPQRFLLINHWTMRIQKRFCWCFCWAKPIPRSGWFYHWRSCWPYFRFPTLRWPMKKISFVDGSKFFFSNSFSSKEPKCLISLGIQIYPKEGITRLPAPIHSYSFRMGLEPSILWLGGFIFKVGSGNSNEPRKTPLLLSIESCLFNRDPYNSLL